MIFAYIIHCGQRKLNKSSFCSLFQVVVGSEYHAGLDEFNERTLKGRKFHILDTTSYCIPPGKYYMSASVSLLHDCLLFRRLDH